MAFGLPGNVGQIAEESIAKIIARQQLEQEMARRAQMDQQQLLLDQQQQQQRVVEHTDSVRLQQGQLDESSANRRARANTEGLGLMGADRERVDMDAAIEQLPPHLKQIAGLMRIGAAGKIAPQDLQTPEQQAGAAEGARQAELTDYEGKRQIDARYRAPSEPKTESRSWVMRGGKPLRVGESEIQPGDAPFSSGGESAQDRQRGARMSAAKGFLDRLNTLRERINTKMGPQAGATGIVRRGAANIGMDPDVAEYERIRAAGGRALAVAIMGAQNLSDQDANAWAGMLPGATVDKETAKRLTDQVGTMLDDAGGTPPAESSGGGGDSPYQRYLKRQKGGP